MGLPLLGLPLLGTLVLLGAVMLEGWRQQLVLELPIAQERDAERAQEMADAVVSPIHEPTEEEAPRPRKKTTYSVAPGQRLPDRRPVVVHVKQVVRTGGRKSSGVAALLELFFAFFFDTFGIGHFYTGAIGVGLFFLFGWWSFLFVNAVMAFSAVGCGCTLLLSSSPFYGLSC
jgi:hypothetical protein